ncbi:LemA family protein, partial [Nitratifractor sp.]
METKRGIGTYLTIAVGALLLLIGGWFFLSYNTLVKKEEATKASWAQVESTMQRKLDLLPNLVKTVKAYAKHETKLLTEVTRLRAEALRQMQGGPTDAGRLKSLAALQYRLDAGIGRLMAVAENYPELKSSEQFLQLQAQIEGTENRINITRMQFNEAVADYNAYLRTLPANIVAAI